MSRKRRLRKILVVILAFALLSGNSGCNKDKKESKSKVTNDSAEKKKNHERFLTIVNKTGQVINEVYVVVGKGTEIDAMHKKNPEKNSFSIKIPKEYNEYPDFKVILEDRYGFQYEKKVDNVQKTDRAEVEITEKDKVKQKGDWKRKIDQAFNGD